MYVIDLTHYLDAKGAIAPTRGPARKIGGFLTVTVVHASFISCWRPGESPVEECR